jgi:hypothetical protein
MKKEAVRCNKCRVIIDLTIPHHITTCACGDMCIDICAPFAEVFKIYGDVSILWSDEDDDDSDDCPCCD